MERSPQALWEILSEPARQMISQLAGFQAKLDQVHLSALFPEITVPEVITELTQVGLLEQSTYIDEQQSKFQIFPYAVTTILSKDMNTLTTDELDHLKLFLLLTDYEMNPEYYATWSTPKFGIAERHRAGIVKLSQTT